MPKNVKNTTFISLLDLIAPHSCRGCEHIGSILCERCKNYLISNRQNFCPNCKSKTKSGKCTKCTDLPPTFVAGERQGLLDKLVHDYKYHSIRALAHPLAEILNQALPTIAGEVAIVPLPTAHHHIRKRGLDHTYLIAKNLAKIRGSHYAVSKLLTRAKDTVQVGADRTTRLHQASEAYDLSDHIKINPNTTYVLFDDVWTTGASLRAATQKLQQAGAQKIIVLILAVSRLD